MRPRTVHVSDVAESAKNVETGHCAVGLSRGLARHSILEGSRCVVLWLLRVRIGHRWNSVQFDSKSGWADTQHHKCWRTRTDKWKVVCGVPGLYQEVPGERPDIAIDNRPTSLQTRLPQKYECHRVERSLAKWPQRLLSDLRRADGNRRRRRLIYYGTGGV